MERILEDRRALEKLLLDVVEWLGVFMKMLMDRNHLEEAVMCGRLVQDILQACLYCRSQPKGTSG